MIRMTCVTVVMSMGLIGCTSRDAPPGPAGPTLSLEGARGIAADVRRTVTEVDGDVETTLSVVDTSVWAPFDDDGTAIVISDDAGMVGPIGLLTRQEFGPAAWQRYGNYLDSAGVLHEIRVDADGGGPWNRIEYRRGGRVVLRHEATWLGATGGWVLGEDVVTHHLDGGPLLRVALRGRHMDVASASAGVELHGLARVLEGWVLPRRLAAQMYFGVCSGDWLKWIGTALLAELAWGRFVRTKSPSDFKKATAATAAAGVALSGLVDCMVEQPEQLDPGS